MLKHLLALALTVGLLAPLQAGTFKLPDESSAYATITIPDSWKPDPYDNGVEALSEDQEVYIAIEGTDAKTVDKSMDDGLKYLKDKGVKVDQASVKQQEVKVNGFDVVDIAWTGTDEDGPCKISLSVVSITDDKGLLMIYWASPAGEQKNQAALTAIAQSIKKL